MPSLPELSNTKIERLKNILRETDTKNYGGCYYTPPAVQYLAEVTHGFVGDS